MVAISLANQKGGVGKTTVTLGFSEAACSLGLRVLVIDCDPQANATAGLALTPDSSTYGLADLIENEVILNAQNKSDYISRSPWMDHIDLNDGSKNGCIDVITSHPRLSGVEARLASDPIGASDRIDRSLQSIKSEYDLILFDCPPSIGHLTINALFASDEVVIISAPSAWSSDGVEIFSNNVERIATRRNDKPSIAGVIINNVGRTRDGKYWESEISGRYEHKTMSIASRAAIAEASAMSQPLSALGSRPGAPEALTNFRDVFCSIVGISKISHSNGQENQTRLAGSIPASSK